MHCLLGLIITMARAFCNTLPHSSLRWITFLRLRSQRGMLLHQGLGGDRIGYMAKSQKWWWWCVVMVMVMVAEQFLR